MAKKFNKINDVDLLQEIEKVDNMSKKTSDDAVMLDIDKIDEDPVNSKIYDMDDIDGLEASVAEYGVTNPIHVFQKADGRYLLYAGHRRTAAAKKAGHSQIKAFVHEWIDNEAERILMLLYDNISNRHEKPMERAREIQVFIEQKQIMHPEWDIVKLKENVCTLFGISRGTCDKLLALTRFIPELQKKAEQPDIYPYSALAYARGLTPEQQKAFSEKLDTFVKNYGEAQLTRDVFREIANEIKNKDRQKKVEHPKSNELESDTGSVVVTDVVESSTSPNSTPTVVQESSENNDNTSIPKEFSFTNNEEDAQEENYKEVSTPNISSVDEIPDGMGLDINLNRVILPAQDQSKTEITESTPEAKRKQYIRSLEASSRDFIATLNLVLDAQESDWIGAEEKTSTMKQLSEIEKSLTNVIGILNMNE